MHLNANKQFSVFQTGFYDDYNRNFEFRQKIVKKKRLKCIVKSVTYLFPINYKQYFFEIFLFIANRIMNKSVVPEINYH